MRHYRGDGNIRPLATTRGVAVSPLAGPSALVAQNTATAGGCQVSAQNCAGVAGDERRSDRRSHSRISATKNSLRPSFGARYSVRWLAFVAPRQCGRNPGAAGDDAYGEALSSQMILLPNGSHAVK